MLTYVAPDASGVQQIWVTGPRTGHVHPGDEREGQRQPSPLAAQEQPDSVCSRGPGHLDGAAHRRHAHAAARARHAIRTCPATAAASSSRIGGSIWTAAPDGSDVRQVKGTAPLFYGLPMAPALSPDGSTIAYFHAELGPNGDFWTIPAAGGTPTRLTSDFREGGWPVWTPDGRTLVVSSARAGSRTLWQIPADGGEPSPLTAGAGEDDQPEISADGRQLAYTNVRNTWDLRVKNLATGEDRMLLQRGLELLFPMFSPDGSGIAFFGRSDYAVAIFTIGVDGSDPRQLTGAASSIISRAGAQTATTSSSSRVSPTLRSGEVPRWAGRARSFATGAGRRAHALFRSHRPVHRLPQTTCAERTADRPRHTVVHEVASGQERRLPKPHTHVAGWSPDGSSIVGWQHGPSNSTWVTVCLVADGTAGG